MTTVKSQKTVVEKIEVESVVTLWPTIRALLEEKKAWINAEIVNYPPPIPACDQYFNHLLQERATIPQAIQRLDDMSGRRSTQKEQLMLAETFLETTSHFKDEETQHIRNSIKQMMLALEP